MPKREVAEFTLQICESAVRVPASGANATLQLDTPLRILPGRREVHEGIWLETGEHIVSKCYLPHPKMQRDWKREWQGLLQLRKLELPAPVPLFTAKDLNSGALWVAMRYIEGAEPIKSILPQLGSGRGALMGQLAQVLAQMQEAGARQTDQHIGNWVFDGSQVYLLDAGTVRFRGKALSAAERINDLATLSATLDMASQDAFCDATCHKSFADRLPNLVIRKQRKRLKKHYKKTRRDCTEYKRQDGPEHKGVSSNKANQNLVKAFFDSPETFMEQGTRLKSGNTCTVQEFEYEERSYVLKRYNLKPLPTRLRRCMKESRAMKSWSNAWCLLTAHIPTARPVAVYEEQRGALPGRSYLLMEAVEGQLLTERMALIEDPAEVIRIVDSVAGVWRALANIRAVHKDMKASNWIIDNESEAVIFDLDALELGLPTPLFLRGHKKDFRRFMKNWSGNTMLEQQFRKKLMEADD